jgi:hypothetical protein
VKPYEHCWSQRLDRMDVVMDDLKRKEAENGGSDE